MINQGDLLAILVEGKEEPIIALYVLLKFKFHLASSSEDKGTLPLVSYHFAVKNHHVHCLCEILSFLVCIHPLAEHVRNRELKA